MPSYSRQLLSGSVNGRAIPVAATVTPGTLIHTALASTTGFDEVYLWVINTDTAAHQITIEWGNAGTVGDHLVDTLTIPANSPPIPIATGQVLQNSLPVRAFADTASKLNIVGFVNRIQ